MATKEVQHSIQPCTPVSVTQQIRAEAYSEKQKSTSDLHQNYRQGEVRDRPLLRDRADHKSDCRHAIQRRECDERRRAGSCESAAISTCTQELTRSDSRDRCRPHGVLTIRKGAISPCRKRLTSNAILASLPVQSVHIDTDVRNTHSAMECATRATYSKAKYSLPCKCGTLARKCSCMNSYGF